MVAMAQITVLLADDNLIVHEGVRAVPRTDPDGRALRLGPPEPPGSGARSSGAAPAGFCIPGGPGVLGGCGMTSTPLTGAEQIIQMRDGVILDGTAGARGQVPAHLVGRAL